MSFKNILQVMVTCVVVILLGVGASSAQNCSSLNVSPTSALVPNSGGSSSFFVNASPSNCSVSFSTLSAPFVVVTSYNQFSGVANYSVASNPGNERIGYIQISSGSINIYFTVDQQAAPPPPEPQPPVVDMFRYNNARFLHHFLTTNFSELGYGGNDWIYEGIRFHVLNSQQGGSVPLYRYYASSTHDHFYTTDFSELGNGGQGYVFEEIQCYVYATQQSGTIPLYRYRNLTTGEHFYTTDINEVGGDSHWVLEKIQAYVLP